MGKLSAIGNNNSPALGDYLVGVLASLASDQKSTILSVLKLLVGSTALSAALQTQVNAGTAGGTMYYINLGGIKLLWGLGSGLLAAPNAADSYTFTLPTSFFSTIQTALMSVIPGVDARSQGNVSSYSTATLTVYLWNQASNSATAQPFVFLIGS